MAHEIVTCPSCGHVTRCRCMGPHEHVQRLCSECTRKGVTIEKVSIMSVTGKRWETEFNKQTGKVQVRVLQEVEGSWVITFLDHLDLDTAVRLGLQIATTAQGEKK